MRDFLISMLILLNVFCYAREGKKSLLMHFQYYIITLIIIYLNAKIKIRERENTFECEYTRALARINIDKVEPKIISIFFSCKNNSRTRRPWSDYDVIHIILIYMHWK